jgi:guanylate kinase
MEKMIANGEFLETTEFSSNLYGTRLLNRSSFISNKFSFFLIILVKKLLMMSHEQVVYVYLMLINKVLKIFEKQILIHYLFI